MTKALKSSHSQTKIIISKVAPTKIFELNAKRELFNAIVYAELFDAENISFVSHENVYSITHDKIHPTGKGAATLARNLGQHLDNVLWQRQRDKRRRPSQPFRGYQPRRGVEESRYHGTYLTGNNNSRVEESRYHGTYHTDNNINNRNEESRYHGTYHTGNNNNNRNEESRYHGTYHTDNNINNRVEESRYHGTYHTDNNINNRVEESRYHGTYHTDNNINNRNEESCYHGTYHTDNNINNRDDNPNAGFWLDNPRRQTIYDIVHNETLQTSLAANTRCPDEFETLTGQVEKLHQDFVEFEKECEAKSELCQFFGVWLRMVAVIKNAVVSDREGNWDLYVATVEDSMPIFAEFNCTNYQRYGSWYLEQIKVLEFTHPELYRRFSMGLWVVKDRPGWFCAVGGDMKVEQTIQRVSKGPGGHYVVGATRNAASVAEFELLFHEIGCITNLLNQLTTNHPMNHTDCHLRHALSPTRRDKFNQNVEKLLDFVMERQNPYSLVVQEPVPLHHLLTKLAVDRQVAERLLKCLENGERVYQSYRQEVLVEKTKKMSATISKRKLPQFNEQPQKIPATILKEKKDMSSKDVAEAQRTMDIAKERGMDITQILAHDLLPVTPLFDGDLPAHAKKSTLVGEIESKLDLTQWNRTSLLPTHVVVDFMSKMQQMPLTEFSTIGAAVIKVIESSTRLCHESDFIHLVLDSYIELSLKEGERMRRRADVTPIDIIGMNANTPIPRQLDKFWASEKNKQNLNLLVRDMVSNRAEGNPVIIASSVICDDEVLPAKAAGGEEIPDLHSWIEEADARLVVHVEWAVRVKQCKRLIVVSNDTDTFALLLHYTSLFHALGLKEIWQQYGTSENRRMLPLHQAVSRLGAPLAKSLIKAHILTGDDCMSKVGTKYAAMAADPVQHLTNFGETDSLSEQDEALAEKYLVHVWAGVKSRTTAETFNQLRVENYTSATAGIDSLPPTSSVIRGHIHRGAFLVHKACHLLGAAREDCLETLEHGWEQHFGTRLPSKCMKPLPPTLITICKCAGKCDTRRCGCCSAGVCCITFCHGKADNSPCSNQ
ncbi:hypothetical protein ACOMHN_027116 [Nucella lapillus]